MKKHGFTLIELIMVIVILGILAVVAIPRFFNLADQARTAAEQGVVGAVRGGIHTFFAQNRTWPTTLEAATDVATTVFEGVLEQGVPTADGWSGPAANVYTGPTGATYTYYPTDSGTIRAGSFLQN